MWFLRGILYISAVWFTPARSALLWDSSECQSVLSTISSLTYLYRRLSSSTGELLPSDDFAKSQLCMHNKFRVAAGLAPVEWDADLALFAHNYMQQSACVMKHSDGEPVGSFYYVGENLYKSWSSVLLKLDSAPRFGEKSVQSWYDELKDYVYGGESNGFNECQPFAGAIGHFTQVMWYDTTHIGCDYIFCGKEILIGCNYGPAGNWVGTAAFDNEAYCAIKNNPDNIDAYGKALATCNGAISCSPEGSSPQPPTTTTTTTTSPTSTILPTTPTTTTLPATTPTAATSSTMPPGTGDGKCMALNGKTCQFPQQKFGYYIESCEDSVHQFYRPWCYNDEWTFCSDDQSDPDCEYPKADGVCTLESGIQCHFPIQLNNGEVFESCMDTYSYYGTAYCYSYTHGWVYCPASSDDLDCMY